MTWSEYRKKDKYDSLENKISFCKIQILQEDLEITYEENPVYVEAGYCPLKKDSYDIGKAKFQTNTNYCQIAENFLLSFIIEEKFDFADFCNLQLNFNMIYSPSAKFKEINYCSLSHVF